MHPRTFTHTHTALGVKYEHMSCCVFVLNKYLGEKKKELILKISHLLEIDTITRSGDFLKINDRVFSFWIKFVYQEKLQSLTFDAKNQKPLPLLSLAVLKFFQAKPIRPNSTMGNENYTQPKKQYKLFSPDNQLKLSSATPQLSYFYLS